MMTFKLSESAARLIVLSMSALSHVAYSIAMHFQMLAIDLDGTLLDSRGRVSEANRRAVRAARQAGVLVVPCTGRGWRESLSVLEQLYDGVREDFGNEDANPAEAAAFDSPGVFVTGAQVCDARTGRSLDLAMMEPHLALEVVDRLRDLPEAVLVYSDAAQSGYDYLVTGKGELTPNTRWWFEQWNARVAHSPCQSIDDLSCPLRVGVVATLRRMQAAVERLTPAMADRVFFHHFEAVQQPDPRDSMHILEIFAAGVDKWRGLQWLADAHGISESRIAAIGDEINDVTMIRNSGYGIAMDNGIGAVRAVADHVTTSNDADGVARAIERLLAGEFDPAESAHK